MNELNNNDKRKQYGLLPKKRIPSINEKSAHMVTPVGKTGTWINFEAIISTDKDQIAITPGELINEWTMAVQNKLRIHKIMMQQHSFPTMGFLTKRASETWMMNRMKSDFLKKMCKFMFRL